MDTAILKKYVVRVICNIMRYITTTPRIIYIPNSNVPTPKVYYTQYIGYTQIRYTIYTYIGRYLISTIIN